MTLIHDVMEQHVSSIMEQYLRRVSKYLHMYTESSCQLWDLPHLNMEVRFYPVVYIWEAQNKNNGAQVIWSLTLAFSPVYTFLLSQQKPEIGKWNTVALLTLPLMFT